MAFGRQQTSLRTVAAYRRALETMGKLAAQQAGTSPATPVNPDSPYVRVVGADATPPMTPRPPSVRSRPRRTQPRQPPTEVATPGPNTRIVTAGDAVARPAPAPLPDRPVRPLRAGQIERDGTSGRPGPYSGIPGQIDGLDRAARPVEPAGHTGDKRTGDMHTGDRETTPSSGAAPPAMLHFDAIDDTRGMEVSSNWADVASTRSDREPRSRPRSASRSRRQGPTFRSSRPRPRRWVAVAAAAAVLIVAGVVGFTLAGGPGSHGRRPALSSHTTAPRQATPPVASARTSPTTAPVTAILVASSVGSSTYRVDASATITFRAGDGACWVQIRQTGPYGPVLFTGDLLAGQTRDVNGPIWVRLGNPRVIAVTVNGTSISPPGMTGGKPYDLQFA